MADGKKSVLVYVDWITIFEELEDEEAGRLIKHFFRYVNDQHPEPPDRITKLVFEPIKQSLKRDLVKYESIRAKNKENAEKRWQQKNATAHDRMPNDAKNADNDNDSVIDRDNDIELSKDNIKKEENIIIKEHVKRFNPPTFEEVLSYCNERRNNVDPQKWFDFYSSKGWMIGKNKMKDWKAAVRTWENNQSNGTKENFRTDSKQYSVAANVKVINASD